MASDMVPIQRPAISPSQMTEMTGATFAERLNLAIGQENAHRFAQRAGISDSTLRRYLSGSVPGVDKLLVLADAAEVTLDWLAAGRGPMRAKVPISSQGPAELPLGFIPVPKVDIRPSAGPGSLVAHEEREPDFYGIREEWLRRLGVSPGSARLMMAKGDSMHDTISDGDLMVVDVSIRAVVDGGIYVLVYGGLVILKRIQMLRSGVLLLKSDNPRYDNEEVPLQEQPELIIEGRVRWAGGVI